MTKINSIKTSNGSVHKIDEGIGFPSRKYIDLEWDGTSKQTYVAPANGYVYIYVMVAKDAYTDLECGILIDPKGSVVFDNILCSDYREAIYKDVPLRINLPVSKGQAFYLSTFNGSFDLMAFRFIYAQGSEPDEE